MRIKPIFTITLTLTALFLVGCSQQDTSPSAPEIASVSLAKGGVKGPPDGDGDIDALSASHDDDNGTNSGSAYV